MKTKSLLIIGLTIVLASCAPASISTPTEIATIAKPTEVITSKIDQNTAVEVARESCVSSGGTQIEEPQESQAALMSLTDGYKKMRESAVFYSISLVGNAVWFVQLMGSWQGVGHPAGTLTPTPSEVPMIWDICEVLVDAQTGQAVGQQFRWSTSVGVGNSQRDTPSAATEYIVQAGDTCRKIAYEHNISVESLIETNQLAPDCSNLTIDQKLIVPIGGKDILVTDTPTPNLSWPAYSLDIELPDSPEQMYLYTQVVPAGLPNDERLAELMAQLKITGEVSTRTSEAGNTTIDVTGDAGSLMLDSDDPLIMVLNNEAPATDSGTPVTILSPDERAQAVKAFLEARKLLDFPYIMEPPRLSRDRDRAIRVVPLIDGYPLYDFDPLNGRLLVWFDPAGEVSVVFWRPLKLVAGDLVNIQPAAVAWEQLVSGDTPKRNGMGQCWQAMLFDPNEPNARAVADPPSCVNWGGKANRSYDAATIDDIKLVYFANDLSLGMSPFAFPADSPARDVFPMWQFSGVTSDGRDLVLLWPAMQ